MATITSMQTNPTRWLGSTLALLLASCAAAGLRERYQGPPPSWPAPEIDAGVSFVEFGAPPPARFPEDRAWSRSREDLGRALFFDGRLSGTVRTHQ